MREPYVKNIRSMVIKVGTSVLTKNNRFDRRMIRRLAAETVPFLRKGIQVSIVSSGAIGAGMMILKEKKRPRSMEGLQAAAAAGQRYLVQCYEEAFSRAGFSTAQVLLTWDDLAQKKRFMNAKRTLKEIQKRGLVPVINENDTVATDEIRFGDNDRLSALLSILVEADVLVILSDTNGLYADGHRHSAKHRIPIVKNVNDALFAHVKDKKNSFTIGGMSSKLKAIRISTSSEIPVFLACGRDPRVLTRIFEGEDIGTFFLPNLKRRPSGRSWLKHFISHIRQRSA